MSATWDSVQELRDRVARLEQIVDDLLRIVSNLGAANSKAR